MKYQVKFFGRSKICLVLCEGSLYFSSTVHKVRFLMINFTQEEQQAGSMG